MKIIQNYKEREPNFYGKAPNLLKKSHIAIDETYKTIDKNSEEYIKYVYCLCKKWAPETYEVNVETNRLQDIVNSNSPALFIMNHTSNQMMDIKAAKFFNALLYREYLYHSKGATCPRTRVLANRNILNKQPDKGELYQWLGVRPIKVGFNNDKEFNKNIINKLVEEFVEKKINLFLFPEGALVGLPFLPLEWKFQPGAASFAKKVLDILNKIKVVPLAFAHNKKQTAIHIGEPLYFSKSDNTYATSVGNAKNKHFNPKLQDYFIKEKESIVIKDNGKAVTPANIIPYLSGIMMENLKACIKNAKEELKNIKPEVFEI